MGTDGTSDPDGTGTFDGGYTSVETVVGTTGSVATEEGGDGLNFLRFAGVTGAEVDSPGGC
jgi:hypothetical protein